MIYKLARRLLQKLCSALLRSKVIKSRSRDFEVAIACGVGVFALRLTHPSDYTLYRVIVFSKAFFGLLHLVGERGFIVPAQPPDVEERIITPETLLTMLSTTLIAYMYIFEHEAFNSSLNKMVFKSSKFWESEGFGITAIRSVQEIKKKFVLPAQ